MSATLQAGIDPAAIVQRFQQSPTLAKAMENPRVMAALMDMARCSLGHWGLWHTPRFCLLAAADEVHASAGLKWCHRCCHAVG